MFRYGNTEAEKKQNQEQQQKQDQKKIENVGIEKNKDQKTSEEKNKEIVESNSVEYDLTHVKFFLDFFNYLINDVLDPIQHLKAFSLVAPNLLLTYLAFNLMKPAKSEIVTPPLNALPKPSNNNPLGLVVKKSPNLLPQKYSSALVPSNKNTQNNAQSDGNNLSPAIPDNLTNGNDLSEFPSDLQTLLELDEGEFEDLDENEADDDEDWYDEEGLVRVDETDSDSNQRLMAFEFVDPINPYDCKQRNVTFPPQTIMATSGATGLLTDLASISIPGNTTSPPRTLLFTLHKPVGPALHTVDIRVLDGCGKMIDHIVLGNETYSFEEPHVTKSSNGTILVAYGKYPLWPKETWFRLFKPTKDSIMQIGPEKLSSTGETTFAGCEFVGDSYFAEFQVTDGSPGNLDMMLKDLPGQTIDTKTLTAYSATEYARKIVALYDKENQQIIIVWQHDQGSNSEAVYSVYGVTGSGFTLVKGETPVFTGGEKTYQPSIVMRKDGTVLITARSSDGPKTAVLDANRDVVTENSLNPGGDSSERVNSICPTEEDGPCPLVRTQGGDTYFSELDSNGAPIAGKTVALSYFQGKESSYSKQPNLSLRKDGAGNESPLVCIIYKGEVLCSWPQTLRDYTTSKLEVTNGKQEQMTWNSANAVSDVVLDPDKTLLTYEFDEDGFYLVREDGSRFLDAEGNPTNTVTLRQLQDGEVYLYNDGTSGKTSTTFKISIAPHGLDSPYKTGSIDIIYDNDIWKIVAAVGIPTVTLAACIGTLICCGVSALGLTCALKIKRLKKKMDETTYELENIEHEQLLSKLSNDIKSYAETNNFFKTEENFKFETINIIGSGGNGDLWLIKSEGNLLARKTINIEQQHTDVSKEEQAFAREARIMSCLNNPNLIKSYGISMDATKNQAAIIMELAGKPISETDETANNNVRQTVQQVLAGLKYMHEGLGLYHGDIKFENILRFRSSRNDGNHTAKLIDFGQSRFKGAYIQILSEEEYREEKNKVPKKLIGRFNLWQPGYRLIYQKTGTGKRQTITWRGEILRMGSKRGDTSMQISEVTLSEFKGLENELTDKSPENIDKEKIEEILSSDPVEVISGTEEWIPLGPRDKLEKYLKYKVENLPEDKRNWEKYTYYISPTEEKIDFVDLNGEIEPVDVEDAIHTKLQERDTKNMMSKISTANKFKDDLQAVRNEVASENQLDGLKSTISENHQRNPRKYTTASDIFSAGLVLWQLVTGKTPYAHLFDGASDINDAISKSNKDEVNDTIIKNLLAGTAFDWFVLENLPSLTKFFKGCLDPNDKTRWTIKKASKFWEKNSTKIDDEISKFDSGLVHKFTSEEAISNLNPKTAEPGFYCYLVEDPIDDEIEILHIFRLYHDDTFLELSSHEFSKKLKEQGLDQKEIKALESNIGFISGGVPANYNADTETVLPKALLEKFDSIHDSLNEEKQDASSDESDQTSYGREGSHDHRFVGKNSKRNREDGLKRKRDPNINPGLQEPLISINTSI